MTRSCWASGWLRRALSRTEVMEPPLRTVAAGSCARAAGRWEGRVTPELGRQRAGMSPSLCEGRVGPRECCGEGVRAAGVGACAAGGPGQPARSPETQPARARRSVASAEPTLAQGAQQQGAGAQLDVQEPLVVLHDGDQHGHHLHGPRQTCQGGCEGTLGRGAGVRPGTGRAPGSAGITHGPGAACLPCGPEVSLWPPSPQETLRCGQPAHSALAGPALSGVWVPGSPVWHIRALAQGGESSRRGGQQPAR